MLEDLAQLSDKVEPKTHIHRSVESQKKKDVSSISLRPFPASSFSFNFGTNKNSRKERPIANRSFNSGEKSSRSSNISNNTSMILDSHFQKIIHKSISLFLF